jgi:hypothetical protein
LLAYRQANLLGLPLLHYTSGVCPETERRRTARGVIAVGAQALGLLALGWQLGIGQLATGGLVVGQLAVGEWVLAQVGVGTHVWDQSGAGPAAVAHFQALWQALEGRLRG